MTNIKEAVRAAIAEGKANAAKPVSRDDWINVLRLAIQVARPSAIELKADFNQHADRIALLLYCTLLDLSSAILLLAEAGPNIGIPTLARQALDAYVDLRNVIHNEGYWRNLELADDLTWRKALEKASAGKIPYYELISASSDLVETRKMQAVSIDRHQRLGASKIEAEERYSLAGLKHEYESIYAMLSAYAHNNVSTLMSRHVIEQESGLQFVLAPHRVPYELAAIGHVADLLLLATNEVHAAYGSNSPDTSTARQAADRLTERLLHDRNNLHDY